MMKWWPAEYGVTPDCAGARAWSVLAGVARPRRLRSAGEYVAACRRLDPRLRSVDGRLIGAGFRRVPPREWIRGERDDGRPPRLLADFIAWWKATQPRPDTVGSARNAQPDCAAAIWLSGPVFRRIARRLPRDHWSLLVARDRDTGHLHVSRRTASWSRELTRFARRTASLRWHVDARTARALGALDPELQRYALSTVPPGSLARVSTIDWDAVAHMRDVMARDATGRIRAAWSLDQACGWKPLPRRFEELALAGCGHTDFPSVCAWLAPAYPRVPFELAVRLCKGESPVQISNSKLTRREAHEWLLAGGPEPVEQWLLRHALGELYVPELRTVRSLQVVRWLLQVHRRGTWDALVRSRTMHTPDGDVSYRYVDVLERIEDEDLSGPGGSGVEAVFRRAAEKSAERYEALFAQDHTILQDPPPWRLYTRCMRYLITPAQLVQEKREMHHCVVGYIPAVRAGRAIIISIDVLGHRSTVELSPDGKVRQHRAEWNQTPHPLCERLLDRFLSQNGLAR